MNRLINALGIRGVGEVMADELAHNFEDLGKLSGTSISDLEKIEGVGPNIALAIVDWLKRETNIVLLEKLQKVGVWPVESPFLQRSSDKMRLSDLSFVITGTLPGVTRDDIKNIILENGGKVNDSVSKNTSYLLVGDQPGSKLDKARNLGVAIITLDEFNQLVQK